MAILIKPDTLFLHVPRCGGTWLAAVLQRLQIEHEVLRRPHAHVLPCHLKIKPRRTITMLRDPLTWYESLWRYVTGRNIAPERWARFVWHPLGTLALNYWDPRFDVFARRMMADAFLSHLYGQYCTPADSILQLERAAQDLADVLKVASEAIEAVPIVNAAKGAPAVAWDRSLRREVTAAEAEARRLWTCRGAH